MKKAVALLAATLLLLTPAFSADAAAKLRATSAPSIAVSIAGGDVVTLKAGKWNQKVKVSYQWFADSVAIKGATKTSLSVGNDLVGRLLKVRATGKNSAGKSATSFSNQVRVGEYELTGSVTAALSPSGAESVEVVSIPTSPIADAKVSYQWYRGGIDIVGATEPKYTLATVDRGTSLSVRVDYTSPTHVTKSIYSNDVAIPQLLRKYSLLWSDEFNGSGQADPNVWVPQEGDGVAYRNKGWGNRELQWYLGSQAVQDGSGLLNIKATKTGADAYKCYYGTCTWLSSKLVTLNKVGFEYGRIEARLRGAPGEGTWAAFWTLGANIDERGWPGCGEIDVMELLGRNPTTTLGYLHGPLSGGPGRGDRLDTGKDLTQGFHVYAVDWLEDQITWYIDGQVCAQVNKTDSDWVFDHEMYLILNVAMGGTLGGNIAAGLNETTMSVDYVRYYSIDGLGKVIQH